MAVYTVTTRTLCEQAYLDKTGTKDPGALQGKSIPEIIRVTAPVVLPESFPVWADATPDAIKEAILRHYYMREIGMETVGLWKFSLATRLQEIMPWYVDLHNRLDKMADIFISDFAKETDTTQYGHEIQKSGTDSTTTTDDLDDTGTIDRTGTDTGSVTKNASSEHTFDNTHTDDGTIGTKGNNLYSDTPQNGLSQVVSGEYLTNATVIDSAETRRLTESDHTFENTTGTDSEQRNLANEFKEVRALKNNRLVVMDVTHGLKDSHGGSDIRTLERTGFSGDKVDVLRRYQELHMNIMQEIIREVACFWMGVIG